MSPGQAQARPRPTWGPEVLSVSATWGGDDGMPLVRPADAPPPTDYDPRFRFTLTIELSDPAPDRTLVVVGANPSTADEQSPDPTMTRLVERARGRFRRIVMLNLSPFRSRYPHWCEEAHKQQSPALLRALTENLQAAHKAMLAADAVLLAWGRAAPKTDGWKLKQDMLQAARAVQALKGTAHFPILTLGWTKIVPVWGQQPRHPLMRSYEQDFELYDERTPWLDPYPKPEAPLARQPSLFGADAPPTKPRAAHRLSK